LFPAACIHGRFQVLHRDHLVYFREAAAKYGRLYIGLTAQRQDLTGRSDRETAERNPLTYWERVEMWRRTLTELDDRLDHVIGPFPIERPDLLVDYVPRSCVCATTIRDDWNSEKIQRLGAAGYEVDVLFTDYDKAISGTDIRQTILSGSSDWTKLVTPRVAEFLIEINIAARLRATSPRSPRDAERTSG
jgi:nicotinamide mononucleotide adenylyltransferase